MFIAVVLGIFTIAATDFPPRPRPPQATFQSIANNLNAAVTTSGGTSVLGTALAAQSLGSFVVDANGFGSPSPTFTTSGSGSGGQ